MGSAEIIKKIEDYVAATIDTLNSSQKKTLEALIFSGYRGEREEVLLRLLKSMGESKISQSELVESFTYTFEGDAVKYWRIKPEFYRAVRKLLAEKT
jgi:hypothetical protein